LSGENSGPSFFKIEPDTGIISPRVDLRSDDTELQYTVSCLPS